MRDPCTRVHSVEEAADALAEAGRLVVLSGAGVSTESGVPDFRSPGGVWSRFDPDDFQFDRFLSDPAGFWRLRARLMDELGLDRIAPNPAHHAIALASRSPRVLGHVTQNIDGLFTAAGHAPDKLVEIHGSAQSVRCLRCDAFYPYDVAREAVAQHQIPPPCPGCAGPLKPGTILFGEQLPEAGLRQAHEWMRHADAVLVVGSSLQVYPVAALPQVAIERGAMLVVINQAPTPYDSMADALVREKAGKALPAILSRAGFDSP